MSFDFQGPLNSYAPCLFVSNARVGLLYSTRDGEYIQELGFHLLDVHLEESSQPLDALMLL